MKGNKTVKIVLIVVVAVLAVALSMAHLSTLKATDEGDANYGEAVAGDPGDSAEASVGTTEYVRIPETPDRSVEISTEFVGGSFAGFGTEVKLTANLFGYEEVTPFFQWQYSSDNGGSWTNVEGANEQTYTFEITEENYTYSWRVEVQAEDPS